MWFSFVISNTYFYMSTCIVIVSKIITIVNCIGWGVDIGVLLNEIKSGNPFGKCIRRMEGESITLGGCASV